MKCKRFLTVAMLSLLTICITPSAFSQSNLRKELEQSITAINAQLPLSLGPSMSWESVFINGQDVVWVFMVNDIGKYISKNKTPTPEIKKNMITMLTGMGDEFSESFKQMADLGLNLHMKMVSENTGDAMNIAFTKAELLEIATKEGVIPMERAKIMAESTNLQAPLSMGAGMTLIGAEIKDGYFTTIVEIDESIYSLDAMNVELAKAGIEKVIKTDIQTMTNCAIAAAADLGICYKYVGKPSKKEVLIKIPLQRLIELLDEL